MNLVPKNWAVFQHYKDRCPPWIKLHRDLLNDREFMSLPTASKALAPLLWLLASENKDGVFDASIDELHFRLRMPKEEIATGIKYLINKGFFVNASAVLADCEQVAIPEGETETETETETENTSNKDLFSTSPAERLSCPHKEIIAMYHEILPASPQVRDWTKARASTLKARWDEDKDRQSLDYWKRFFEYVSTCDFLVGKSYSKDKRPFLPNLVWMVKPENFAKIREGIYENN